MGHNRVFARSSLDQTRPVVHFTSFTALECRGGLGDEVVYSTTNDSFTADDLPEAVPNPCPGNPLEGAAALILPLEARAF